MSGQREGCVQLLLENVSLRSSSDRGNPCDVRDAEMLLKMNTGQMNSGLQDQRAGRKSPRGKEASRIVLIIRLRKHIDARDGEMLLTNKSGSPIDVSMAGGRIENVSLEKNRAELR